jgi:transcriptional regulator with XRE-family HTH domain
MKTAKAIAKARKARGLSQAELAKILGVSAGTVAAWETARHGVRLGRLSEVAQALHVDVAELVA